MIPAVRLYLFCRNHYSCNSMIYSEIGNCKTSLLSNKVRNGMGFMEERADNFFYIVRSIFFVFIAVACLLVVSWFLGAYYEEKAFIADYDDSAGGYYIFYEQNKKKQSEPLLIVKARDFSNNLYVSEYGRDNWRLLKKEIDVISGKEQIKIIKRELLKKMLENHNNNYCPQTIEYRLEPNSLQIWVIDIRNYLKKLF